MFNALFMAHVGYLKDAIEADAFPQKPCPPTTTFTQGFEQHSGRWPPLNNPSLLNFKSKDFTKMCHFYVWMGHN